MVLFMVRVGPQAPTGYVSIMVITKINILVAKMIGIAAGKRPASISPSGVVPLYCFFLEYFVAKKGHFWMKRDAKGQRKEI